MASQPNNHVAVIRQNLTAMAPQFQAALPSHITVEKFTRVAMTAIQNNPDLATADRNSLFGSIVRLAQDGLLPDGREAAIVLFAGKAQAMPMIGGILKKIRQSGDVSYVSAQIVYSNDHFEWTLGFDEAITHRPAPLDEEPGEPVAAYAVAVLKDGSRLLEVMRKSEIEKVRNVSRAKGNGPWVQWWGEMARKTVMRRLSKRLPMSTDLEDEIFSRDETLAHVERPELAVIDGGQAEQPVSRLDALEHHIEGVEEEITLPAVDEEALKQTKLQHVRDSIEAAKNEKGLAAVEADWMSVRAGYEDATVEEIAGLIAGRRDQVK